MQNLNYKITTGQQSWVSQASLGYRRFQICWVIVEYGLFNTTNLIQNQICIRFGIFLTQLYINFSWQEHQIDVLYISFNSCDSQVSVYTLFHFSFTVPLNIFEPRNSTISPTLLIRHNFKGYRCVSGIAIFAGRVIWNYTYSPFR